MSQFRAVVVGAGFIGPVHVEALRRAGVTVAGVVDITPEKSVAASESLGLPAEIQSFEAALADPTVDSIHLTTPNRFHFEQAAAVLRAGKHVVCEKPLAMNSTESAELVKIARQSGRAAAVNYNLRFYPLSHEAAARVKNGSVGKVVSVVGSYVQDWLLKETDFNWRVLAADGGELRAVADIGTHWLDLIQFVTGESITSVCADLRTVYPTRLRPTGEVETFSGGSTQENATEPVEITTEDCGAVMLRFANGGNGCLWVSQTTAGKKNCLRYELSGTKQSLSWNSESPNAIEIGNRDTANECLLRDPSMLSPSAAALASYPGGHNEGFPDTFKQLFRTFYRYVAEGDLSAPRPFPTFEDGHREILLCEAILKSHRERRWVEVAGGAAS